MMSEVPYGASGASFASRAMRGNQIAIMRSRECDTVASRPLPREALHALISRWVTSGARSYYSGGKPGSLLASTSNARIPSASASASVANDTGAESIGRPNSRMSHL
jgi:hypothetical protein